MATAEQTLAIIAAAEGSYYDLGGKIVDLRYAPSFANTNSGMSFGAFQFDVATNDVGKRLLFAILERAVAAKALDRENAARLYAQARRRNAKASFSGTDLQTMKGLLGESIAVRMIDAADRDRAATLQEWIDGIIAKAAQLWAARKIFAPILTPGGVGNLRLFAYVLASLNRFPANERVIQNWLEGKHVHTAHSGHHGFYLKAPPSLDEMHKFLRSLRIWDGTQGNYQYLQDRLEPTLLKLGA